jgi:hypothetical protein
MAENQGWVEELLNKYVHRLSKKIRVERVIVFGSRARGDFMETSDLDLLVVSPDFKGKDHLERAKFLQKIWNAVNTTPLKLEAFGYTEEEIRKMKSYSPFIRKIMRNGYVEIRIS